MKNEIFGNRLEVLLMRRTITEYNFFLHFKNIENGKTEMEVVEGTASRHAKFFQTHEPDFSKVDKFLHNKFLLISSVKFKENPSESERMKIIESTKEEIRTFTLPIYSTILTYDSYFEFAVIINNKEKKITLLKVYEKHDDS